jgi:hypothetical protein
MTFTLGFIIGSSAGAIATIFFLNCCRFLSESETGDVSHESTYDGARPVEQ